MSAEREDEIREQADRLEREGDEMAEQLDKLEGHLDEARSTAQEHREQHVEATVKDPQGGGGGDDDGEAGSVEDAAGAWAEGEPATVGKSSSEGDSGERDEAETREMSADDDSDDSDEKSSGG